MFEQPPRLQYVFILASMFSKMLERYLSTSALLLGAGLIIKGSIETPYALIQDTYGHWQGHPCTFHEQVPRTARDLTLGLFCLSYPIYMSRQKREERKV